MRLPLLETTMTILCISILAGLGTWQLQRLEWKNTLIQKLETAYAQETNNIIFSSQDLNTFAAQKSPMAYGTLSGRFLRDKAILLGPKTLDGKAGYHLIIPLLTNNQTAIFINTGWVSDMWKDTKDERLSSIPSDKVTVTGLLRLSDWTSFTSNNSPSNDLWFRADVMEMANARDIQNPYPLILYRNLSNPEFQDIVPHEKGWLPRNNHLEYAIFWYTMGMILAVIFGLYIFTNNKKKAP